MELNVTVGESEVAHPESMISANDDSTVIARKILETVLHDPVIRSYCPLDGGIVYRHVPRANVLCGFASICAPGPNIRDARYVYHKDEVSAAGYAFYHEDFFALNPSDEHVNQGGAHDFGIKGPLFAVRLGDDKNAFGTVVAWCSNPQYLTKDILKLILDRIAKIGRDGAKLLGQALYAEDTAKRKILYDRTAQTLQQMMSGADLKTNLTTICDGLAAVGFPRVRIYQFRYNDTLKGFMARGMEGWGLDFGSTDAHETRIDDNKYTQMVYDGVCRARNQSPNGGQPEDLLARLFPIKDNGVVQTDNSASKVGKPKYMPWVESPILSAGRFFGILVADKLISKEGQQPEQWEETSEVDLDAIDTFAQLAGRAFAMEEKRGMLIQKHLVTLDVMVDLKVKEDLVRRRLLMFAAHGEEGLGFNRVLYFLPSEPGKSYVFCHAVGSLTGDGHRDLIKGERKEWSTDKSEHNSIRSVREMSLREVLSQANLSDDSQLNGSPFGNTAPDSNGEQQPFTIYLNAKFEKPRRYKKTDNDALPWLRDLQKRIHGGVEDIIVAPMLAGDVDMGLLIVDRPFAEQYGIVDSEVESLESFARHAAQILLRHRALATRLKHLHALVGALSHELRDPLGKIREALNVMTSHIPAFLQPWSDTRGIFESERKPRRRIAKSFRFDQCPFGTYRIRSNEGCSRVVQNGTGQSPVRATGRSQTCRARHDSGRQRPDSSPQFLRVR